MDMLNGGLVGKLILFSLPLAFSSILQQLFNSADVAVVGRFAGDNALAAVGSCVALVGIFVNLIVGLAVGPNAVLANLIGQKQRDKINDIGTYDPDIWHNPRTWAYDPRLCLCPDHSGIIRYSVRCSCRSTVIYPHLFLKHSVYDRL